MCGRFSLALPAQTIAEFFKTLVLQAVPPRYNIAPTQDVLAIRARAEENGRYAQPLRWGLVPSWSKDIKIGAKLTNARSETLGQKPSFRNAYKYRRCLIPTDGFYEWKRDGAGKQPYFFHAADKSPLGFAGLWEHWSGPSGEELETCTIITTDANRLMAPVHHRMPVILKPEDYDRWLDPGQRDRAKLESLLVPCPDGLLAAYPVGTHVNRAGNEGPKCIEPMPTDPPSRPPLQGSLF